MSEATVTELNRVKEEVREGFPWKVDPFARTKDNVAIVGFTSHRDEALKLGEDWELWGLNELHRYMPVGRFDRWFEIHDRSVLANDPGGPEHLADLAKMQVPVYMHQHWDDIPPSLPFPADEVVEALGRDYFTNCPAWMIGMAIAMGFRRIHVYGVDMATNSEYMTQRPCCEYWLGVAQGMGIDVAVPDVSDLLKCVGRYGYASGDLLVRKLDDRMKYLHAKDNDLLGAMRSLEAEYQSKHNSALAIVERTRGAIGELRLRRQTPKTKDRIATLEEEVNQGTAALQSLEKQYDTQMKKLNNERQQVIGGLQDCTFWRQSWAVTGAAGSTAALPDRTQDPRTGITERYEPKAPSVDSPEPSEVVT